MLYTQTNSILDVHYASKKKKKKSKPQEAPLFSLSWEARRINIELAKISFGFFHNILPEGKFWPIQ